MPTIATNFKFLRKYTGLSQSEFGKKFELTRGMIDSYERAIAKPSTEIISTVAKYFNIPIEVLTSKDLTLNPGLLFSNVSVANHTGAINKDLLKAKDEMIAHLKEENKFLKATIEQLTITIKKQQNKHGN